MLMKVSEELQFKILIHKKPNSPPPKILPSMRLTLPTASSPVSFKILHFPSSKVFLKDIMEPFLPMGRQEQEKHLPWKVQRKVITLNFKVLYQDPSVTFLKPSKMLLLLKSILSESAF